MNKIIISLITMLIIGFLTFHFFGKKEMVIIKNDNTLLWDCKSIEKDGFKLSGITHSFSLLPLETGEEFLMGGIDKIIMKNNYVYVLDSKYTANIYIFDAKSGQFVKKIGKIGNGPGEYRKILDFSIDEDNLVIYALCDRSKVVSYSLSGIFLEEKKLSFFATAIEYLNNKFYFVNDELEKDNLCITDKEYNVVSSLFPNKKYGENMRILIHPFLKKNNEILYRRFLDDNIYKIDSIGKVSLLYQIDFGSNKIDFDKINSLSSGDLKQKMSTTRCHIKYFLDNDKYSVIVFFDKNTPLISIYDKFTNKAKTYPYNLSKDNLLDGEFPLLEYLTPENQFISILSFNAIEQLMKKEKLNKETKIEDLNPILYIIESK